MHIHANIRVPNSDFPSDGFHRCSGADLKPSQGAGHFRVLMKPFPYQTIFLLLLFK